MIFNYINPGRWFSAEGYQIFFNVETGNTFSLYKPDKDYRNPIGTRYRTLNGAIKAAAKHNKETI